MNDKPTIYVKTRRLHDEQYEADVTVVTCNCTYCKQVAPCLTFVAEHNQGEYFSTEVCLQCLLKFIPHLAQYPNKATI